MLDYDILLQGDFMCRLKQEGEKNAKFKSKGIPIALKNLDIGLNISI